MHTHINEEISQLKTYTEKVYQQEKEAIDKEWLKTTLDKFYHPKKYFLPKVVVIKPTIGELFDEFLNKHPLSEVRKKNFRVVKRALPRYELYARATKRRQKNFILDVDLVTPDTLMACRTSFRTNTITMNFTRAFMKPFPKRGHYNPEAITR